MGNFPLDTDVLEYGSESALWCWEIRDLKLMLVKARNILSTRKSIRKKIHEKTTNIYLILTLVKNDAPGESFSLLPLLTRSAELVCNHNHGAIGIVRSNDYQDVLGVVVKVFWSTIRYCNVLGYL